MVLDRSCGIPMHSCRTYGPGGGVCVRLCGGMWVCCGCGVCMYICPRAGLCLLLVCVSIYLSLGVPMSFCMCPSVLLYVFCVFLSVCLYWHRGRSRRARPGITETAKFLLVWCCRHAFWCTTSWVQPYLSSWIAIDFSQAQTQKYNSQCYHCVCVHISFVVLYDSSCHPLTTIHARATVLSHRSLFCQFRWALLVDVILWRGCHLMRSRKWSGVLCVAHLYCTVLSVLLVLWSCV